MKSFVAIFALVAVAAADVSHLVRSPEAGAEIIQQSSDVDINAYNYQYQTSNGISGQESGQLKNAGREDEAIEVQGSHQHTAPDGQVYSVSYIANENGYQPQGDHLPTPPPTQPIPEYILRSLQYIADHPPAPEPLRRI